MALLLVWAAEAVVFALVVAGILAERPLALAATGAALVAAGALVRFVPPLRAALAGAFARHRAAALAGGALLALVLPLALRASPYWTFVATLALLYITIGQGLNLQIGTAGVLNLAGAAFAGLGGYAVGLLTVSAGWPPWLAVLVAPWVAVVVGTVLFVPILKTRGHYLALVTIAFVFIFNILMNNFEFTGGPQGIKNIPTLRVFGYAFTTKPVLFGVELPAHANFYYATLAVAALTPWIFKALPGVHLALLSPRGEGSTSSVTMIFLSVAILIVPTTLMGGTLPALTKFILRKYEELGTKVGRLYFANTLGAAAGAILAGFFLIARKIRQLF